MDTWLLCSLTSHRFCISGKAQNENQLINFKVAFYIIIDWDESWTRKLYWFLFPFVELDFIYRCGLSLKKWKKNQTVMMLKMQTSLFSTRHFFIWKSCGILEFLFLFWSANLIKISSPVSKKKYIYINGFSFFSERDVAATLMRGRKWTPI